MCATPSTLLLPCPSVCVLKTEHRVASDVILTSEILANICLINYNNLSWIQVSALLSRLHAHSKADRDVRNRENHNTSVFRSVLSDSSQMTLEHMVAVKECLFTVWFDPDLVFGVLGQVVQASDVELKFLCFREFAKACASAEKFVLTHM